MSAKHTPGPWRWELNRKHKSVRLCGGLPIGTYDKTVMDFSRYGMTGAAPVFHNWTQDGWGGQPQRADELAVEQAGREHHSDWFALINHPNANLIAAAPELLEALKGLYLDLVKNDQDGLIEFVEPMRKASAAIAKAEAQS